MRIHKNISYQNLRLIFILLGFTFFISNKAEAQASVVVGQQYYYTFSSYGNPDWWYIEAQNGTIVNQGMSWGVPYAYVVWSCAGPGFVRYVEYHETNGESSVQENVSVSCPSIGTPSTSFTYTQNCRSTTITRTSNPPAGQTWYWQVSPTGTETSYGSGATFAAGLNIQYYLRPLSNGCCWGPAVATATVSIIDPALPTASNVSICGSGAAPLSASPGAQANLIRWYSYSNVFITESANYNPTISSTTNYFARSYNSSVNCESGNKLVTATVNSLPSAPAAASSSPTSFCGSGSVTLSASGAVGGESYRWYTSPSGGSALPNNTPSVGSTTTYYAAKRIDATGCEGSRTGVTVQVNAIPATYTVSGNHCGSGTVWLNGSQAGMNYQLQRNGVNEGAPIAGTGAGLSWPDKSSGAYIVIASNSNGSCGTTMSGSAIINSLPGAPASASSSPGSICGSSSVTLSASGAAGGESYRWYTTSSGGSALPNNTPSVSTSTTYYVAKRIDATGCEGARIPVTVQVNAIPSTFTVSGTTCGSGPVMLSSSQSGMNYQLRKNGIDEGAPMAGTGGALTWSDKAAGAYTVIVSNSNGTCATSMSGSAIISALPGAPSTASASPSSLCGSSSVTLSASGAGVGESYRWYTTPSGGSALPNNTPSVSATSTYYVAKRTDATGCEGARTLVTIPVNPIPITFTINGGGNYCVSGTVTLSGSQAGVNYQLRKNGVDEGSVTNGTGSGLSWSGKSTGTYTVVATNGNGSCGTTMSSSAVINTDPATTGGTVGSSAEQYGTANGTLTLTSHTGSVVRWEKNEGSGWITLANTSATNAYTNVSLTTQYRAVVKSGVCAEVPSASATLTIFPTPQINVNGSTYVTYGVSSQLTTSSPFYSYQWKKGGVDISGATGQTLLVKEPGLYTVSVKGSPTASAYLTSGVNIQSTLAAQPVNLASVTRILKEGVTESTSLYSLQPQEVAQGISYFDGLGRMFQSVAVAQSPARADIVQQQGYSKNGLQDTTFLPYVSTAGDGQLRLNAIRSSNSYASSEQYQFYQNTAKVASDTYPFARTLYRNTPDAKVTEQGAPGIDGQPGSTHTTRNVITFNNASYPILNWKTDGTCYSNHLDNAIRLSITTDENNNKVRTYTNTYGQTLLKEVQLDETLEGVSTPWLETYFIYDEFGRLIYQLPPKSMKVLRAGISFNANNPLVAELIYKYTYDNKNRLLIKKEPGAAEQHFVYDKHDRLVFTQDGNLRGQTRWMFMKYDQYNRVVYSGVYDRDVTRATLQAEMDARNYDSEPYFDVEQVNETYHGYSNQVYPTTDLTVLTVNYYDHYDFDRNDTADYTYDNAHLAGQVTAALLAPRGLSTGSKRVTIDEAGATTTNWLVSAVFFDAYQRPVQSQSNNHLYLTVADKSTVRYDFSGKALQTKTTHCQDAGTCINLTDRNEYDHAGRVLNMFRTINSNPEQQLVRYEYNALGQVVDKKLHVAGESFLQSVDFRYTIQGQLKSINNAQLVANGSNNDEADDFFGMELVYNTVESGLENTPYYNGNISALKWKAPGQSSGAEDQRSYKYAYDKSDRLKTATFNAHDGVAWSKESNTLNENMTYDHNGNIKTLLRNQNLRGLSGLTITSTPETVDNLTYTYANNFNALTKVEDTGLATGFSNGANITTEYTYYSNGSVRADHNKGISNTTYNLLGKPQAINFTDGRKVEYTYSAAGEKLSMKTYQGATLLTTTNYSGSFVYEGAAPILNFFGSPEGRVVKKGSVFEYEYALADHQGNTRLVFSSATPTPGNSSANMEGVTNNDFENYVNRTNFELFDHTDPGDDGSDHSQLLTGGSNSQVGVAKSMRVYPGDKVKIEAYAKYYNPQSTSSNLNGFALALTSAFGVTSSSTGEALKAFNTLNSYGGIIAGSGGEGSMHPKLFVNILLFDKDFKLVDAAWQQIDGGEQVGISPKAAHDYMMQEVDVKEAGYAYIYVSNENATLVEFYVDDVVITHTPSNIIQYNEYYPFGMQTANSWTRENTTGNSFLYNEASELNTTSGFYDLPYRAYDPVLGRMNGVDPLASKYASLTPYNYSNNDPVFYTDPSGAEYGVPEWMRDRIDQLPHVHGGGGDYGGYGGMGYSSQLELPMLLSRARYGDENALNDYYNRYGTTYTIRTIDWYAKGIVDAEHYLDTEYRFVEQQGTDGRNSQILQAGLWTSSTDDFDRASIYLGLKGLGVDLAAQAWKNSSNASQWKQAYNIHKSLKSSLFLKANGINIVKTSSIKAAIPSVLKSTGVVLGVAAGAVTVTQVIYNREIKASNVLDATVTAASFIPLVGWAIGGSYFIADVTTRLVTDKSIGEHLDSSNYSFSYKF